MDIVISKQQEAALAQIPEKWGSPPKQYLSQIKRGGVSLDYMGHAQLRACLTVEDPAWSWAPMSLDADGLPALLIVNGQTCLWIYLTVHGKTQPGCGTAKVEKDELLKELIGDALRNAAMTFGFGLALWAKEQELITGVPEPLGTPPEGPLLAEQDPPGPDIPEGPFHPTEGRSGALKARANQLLPKDRRLLRNSIEAQHLSWDIDTDLDRIEVLLQVAEMTVGTDAE